MCGALWCVCCVLCVCVCVCVCCVLCVRVYPNLSVILGLVRLPLELVLVGKRIVMGGRVVLPLLLFVNNGIEMRGLVVFAEALTEAKIVVLGIEMRGRVPLLLFPADKMAVMFVGKRRIMGVERFAVVGAPRGIGMRGLIVALVGAAFGVGSVGNRMVIRGLVPLLVAGVGGVTVVGGLNMGMVIRGRVVLALVGALENRGMEMRGWIVPLVGAALAVGLVGKSWILKRGLVAFPEGAAVGVTPAGTE